MVYFAGDAGGQNGQEVEGGTGPHTFEMSILDQGDYGDTAWRDPLIKMLKGYEPTTSLVVK